ncbi:protein of unknown function [Microbacterium sp. Nx66]|nr:protein of unknown function [Microbacterium sp. Nx66]
MPSRASPVPAGPRTGSVPPVPSLDPPRAPVRDQNRPCRARVGCLPDPARASRPRPPRRGTENAPAGRVWGAFLIPHAGAVPSGARESCPLGCGSRALWGGSRPLAHGVPLVGAGSKVPLPDGSEVRS